MKTKIKHGWGEAIKFKKKWWYDEKGEKNEKINKNQRKSIN